MLILIKKVAMLATKAKIIANKDKIIKLQTFDYKLFQR